MPSEVFSGTRTSAHGLAPRPERRPRRVVQGVGLAPAPEPPLEGVGVGVDEARQHGAREPRAVAPAALDGRDAATRVDGDDDVPLEGGPGPGQRRRVARRRRRRDGGPGRGLDDPGLRVRVVQPSGVREEGVAVVLVEGVGEHEAAGRRDVREEDPVQVVLLVLQRAGRVARRQNAETRPVGPPRGAAHLGRAGHAAADAGDGEAALEDLHGRLVHDLELRVDEDRQR